MIADGGQLATQKLYWRAMLQRLSLEVNNADTRACLQGGCEIVKERIRLADLVIHVNEYRGIQGE